jgi:hypothetical protein
MYRCTADFENAGDYFFIVDRFLFSQIFWECGTIVREIKEVLQREIQGLKV